jgi:hypothetical protein
MCVDKKKQISQWIVKQWNKTKCATYPARKANMQDPQQNTELGNPHFFLAKKMWIYITKRKEKEWGDMLQQGLYQLHVIAKKNIWYCTSTIGEAKLMKVLGNVEVTQENHVI